VHTAITGTARLEHLMRNVEIVDRGPLPREVCIVHVEFAPTP
jgi:hypothetical protein